MTAPAAVTGGTAPSHRVAVLFGYNGASYNGLERLDFGFDEAKIPRNKGGRTVEGEILNAIATLTAQSDAASKVTLVNISRASTTEEGEHAARQVISLEIRESAIIPTPDALNAILPETIRVFKISTPTDGFSARRTCDARTYEYLIPTYAFSPPPLLTGYAHQYQPGMSREELDALYPEHEGPTGKLFTTMKRGQTLRRKTGSRPTSGIIDNGALSPPMSPTSDSKDLKTAPTTPTASSSSNPFSRFFETITRGRDRKNKNEKADASKPSISNVVPTAGSRSRSAPANAHRAGSNANLVDDKKKKNDNGGFYGKAGWDNGSTTSSNGSDEDDDAVRYYDPIDVPIPTEEQLSIKRRFRITPEQVDMLRHIVSIYRGTHNFHNYIPGASYDDERCYMRILSMELSDPEVHFGMEWIRVKVQAKAFARFQIRRMLAMMVLVVRTNTPRSVVANSFGFAQIDLPEAPAIGLICDEPFYLEYNANQSLTEAERVDFSKERGAVETFRKAQIHDWVFREEQEYMYFDAWLRSIDRFAFLYHFFLNNRGLIQPRRAFLNPNAQAEYPTAA
ncbi:tRNA pseudouridine synthase 1 [Phlyctochytrium planicorne]|nr:tRNA pseudouridine synthase 1 [Phlyctochytrium planicorne]